MNTQKSGRTILIFKDQTYNKKDIANIETEFISEGGSIFLYFKEIIDAEKCLSLLNEKNVKCKYSYYKLFYRISKKELGDDIEVIKNTITDSLTSKVENINIIFHRHYVYNNNPINSGYLIVDNINDFSSLIKEDVVYNGEEESIKFFKFNKITK